MNAPHPLAGLEAEQQLLSCLLASSEHFDRIGALQADHFYAASHRAIFAQIEALIAAQMEPDTLAVYERLQQHAPDYADLAYLSSLLTSFFGQNVEHYSAVVIERSRRRRLAELGDLMAEAAATELATPVADIIDRAQGELQDMLTERQADEPVHVADDMREFLDDLDRRSRGEGEQAMSTGFVDLDAHLGGGIRPGNLIVVAARPKMGKTALALNIARNIADGRKVLVLSMEMGRKELHARNIAALGRMPLAHLVDAKKMQDSDWSRAAAGTELLSALGLYVHNQGEMRLAQVRAVARAIQRKHGLHLLVIDYLQLMAGDGDTRNAQIEQITRGLKGLAMTMGVGILLLSQLNRNVEARPNKRPMPSDLRDSGAIEQDCDAALFLYRDEVYNENSQDRGICEVNVGLNRQGEPGRVGLSFIAHESRFENLAAGWEFGRPQKPIYSGGLRD
ncbi:replicative DNA helicase [Achromobacter aegrifaciens]|uniref:replicative DNA helicase n=1 Tax=Achromobacter aegrifaciens TaxID=1287736 RepID=UPI000F73A344|nr:replicative DNA helicase [Achromobacter aegrifaciens]RSE90326.1 replicative DNA helicase [Achromobacter aegrifaciens]